MLLGWLGFLLSSCESTATREPEAAAPPAMTEPDLPFSPHQTSVLGPEFLRLGRMRERDGGLAMVWTGTQLSFRVKSDSIWLHAEPEPERASRPPDHLVYLTVIIDDEPPRNLALPYDRTRYLVATGLGDGAHTVTLFKRTEAMTGSVVLKSIELSEGGEWLAPPPQPERLIEFIGNSITCGYGNLGDPACSFSAETEDGYQTYAALATRQVRARMQTVCYSGRGVWRNYDQTQTGLLPELYLRYHPLDSTATYPFNDPSPDVVVINLGTNDFSSGNPPEKPFVQAYAELIRTVRQYHPKAAVVLLTGPMLNQDDGELRRPLSTQKQYLDAVVAQLSAEGMTDLYRFDLSPQVDGESYGCNFHPAVAKHRQNGQELARFLAQTFDWPYQEVE